MDYRCFIAIGISDSIKKEIGKLLDIMQKHDADIKWVEPENIHLTLKFLGSTPDTLLPEVRESLSNILSSYKPFYIKIYGTGIFPNRKYPRVIWTGINDSDILDKMKGDVEQAMALLGFQKEDKKFNPHLTLGRVRSSKGVMNIVSELDNYKNMEFGNLHVDRIKLMKSDLKPKGAVYTCLNDIPLTK
jgi:RNA 2',3'-cyclic 3'-phosphodiesterase